MHILTHVKYIFETPSLLGIIIFLRDELALTKNVCINFKLTFRNH